MYTNHDRYPYSMLLFFCFYQKKVFLKYIPILIFYSQVHMSYQEKKFLLFFYHCSCLDCQNI